MACVEQDGESVESVEVSGSVVSNPMIVSVRRRKIAATPIQFFGERLVYE